MSVTVPQVLSIANVLVESLKLENGEVLSGRRVIDRIANHRRINIKARFTRRSKWQ